MLTLQNKPTVNSLDEPGKDGFYNSLVRGVYCPLNQILTNSTMFYLFIYSTTRMRTQKLFTYLLNHLFVCRKLKLLGSSYIFKTKGIN